MLASLQGGSIGQFNIIKKINRRLGNIYSNHISIENKETVKLDERHQRNNPAIKNINSLTKLSSKK